MKQLNTLIILILILLLTGSCKEQPDFNTITPSTEKKTYTIQELEKLDYNLQVIFHIMGPENNNIHEAIKGYTVKSVINGVNNIYNGKYGGTNINVQFLLAERTPEGKILPQAGIHRAYSSSSDIDFNIIFNDKPTGKYHQMLWNLNKYINIFIFNYPDTYKQVAGVSTIPYLYIQNLDGLETYSKPVTLGFTPCITLNARHLVSPENFTDSEFISTLAHELGHYLGLYHPFITKEAPKHDYCSDTYEYDRDKYEGKLKGIIEFIKLGMLNRAVLYKRQPLNTGEEFTSYNIMDYYFSYNNRFTPEQRRRIRTSLYFSPITPGPKSVNIKNLLTTRSDNTETAQAKYIICSHPKIEP